MMMKKFRLVAIALVALFAFLAVTAMSASAETLKWLVENEVLVGELAAETEGELTLVRLINGVIGGKILCEGIFDGLIANPANGGAGQDQITSVLFNGTGETAMTQAGEEVGETLIGTAIECTVIEKNANADLTFCKTGGLGSALVWPANLPWLSELVLMTGATTDEWLDTLVDGGKGEPGYDVECTTLLGIKASDLCIGNTSALVLFPLETWPGTTVEGSHGEFNFEPPISSEAGNCKTAGNGVAELEGLGVTWAIEKDLVRLETDVRETP